MNDIEIDLMKKLLEMDPYQRLTAKQALNHEFFDDLRSKDSDYGEDEDLSVEIAGTLGQDSGSQIIRGNKRILSPDMVNQKNKPGQSTNITSSILSKNNKNSFSQVS